MPNHFIHAIAIKITCTTDLDPATTTVFLEEFYSTSTRLARDNIHPSDVSEFLSHLDLPVDERHCGPVPLDIIRRLIGNVAYAFERNGHITQAENMRKFDVCRNWGYREFSGSSTDSDAEAGEGLKLA